MQQTPPKKYDFFDNNGFNDILQPTAPKSSPWSMDPFPKTSSATPVTSSTGFVDGNFNQVSQQNQVNKVVNGQSDSNKTFPFTRSTMQKAGNVSMLYFLIKVFVSSVKRSLALMVTLGAILLPTKCAP